MINTDYTHTHTHTHTYTGYIKLSAEVDNAHKESGRNERKVKQRKMQTILCGIEIRGGRGVRGPSQGAIVILWGKEAKT